VASAGGSVNNEKNQISCTIGETVIHTIENNEILPTQGSRLEYVK
jgi:hypothetical protein